MSADHFRVAEVQTVSGGDVGENLAAIAPRVAEAAGRGAQLVLLPEYFGIFGARSIDKVAAREPDGTGPQQDFLAGLAREHGVGVGGGRSPVPIAEPARGHSPP